MAWYDFIIRCTACGRARVRRAVLSSGCAAARHSPLAATPAAFTAVHGIPCVRARLRRSAVRRRRVLTHRRTPRRQDVALPDADAHRRIDIRARPAARLCAGGLPVARRARRAAAAARHRVRRRTPRRRADDQRKRARRPPRPLRGLEPTWRARDACRRAPRFPTRGRRRTTHARAGVGACRSSRAARSSRSAFMGAAACRRRRASRARTARAAHRDAAASTCATSG